MVVAVRGNWVYTSKPLVEVFDGLEYVCERKAARINVLYLHVHLEVKRIRAQDR